MDTSQLPIRQHAADILAAVAANDVVVVIGETGSGKTTQLSQILLEAGYGQQGIIGVTQPRRVGAVTVARRVAEERGCELGGEVGYAVRFENRTSSSTRIKYLTDGTLLQECLEDANLNKYQVIILDEAHERSLNTDILFGVIKQLLATQAENADGTGARSHKLKLLVTSATLDGEKFSTYFNNCPVFNVPGRCYPVDIIHSQDDHMQDYSAAAIDTALQIHLNQPQGDILVFLTGQAEIDKAVAKLNAAVCSLPEGSAGDLLVLPLYAALPPELQLRVFRPPEPGVRRCIIATNVAETSITVEGVVYVVDSGVMKLKSYNASTGMDSLDVVAISRVQAAQRAGRAGRTRPGKCFRLYTRSYFERKMPDTTPPEICRTSLSGAVLQLKALNLPGLDVLSFGFLDPPDQSSLCEALRQLYVLDALDIDGAITQLGRTMAALPLEPALARALIEAHKLGCLDEVITVAAMLSAEHVFSAASGLTGPQQQQQGGPGGGGGDAARKIQALATQAQGDHLLLLCLYQLWAAAGFSKEFVRSWGLDLRGMNFAREVRRQLAAVAVFDQPRRAGQDAAAAAAAGGNQQQQQQDGGDAGRERKRRRWDEDKPARLDTGDSQQQSGGGGYGSSGSRQQQPGGSSIPHHQQQHPRDSLPSPSRPPSRGGGRTGQPSPAVCDLVRRALTVGFANRIARRMRLHNGYRTCNEKGALAQIHPSSSQLSADDDGLLPEWLIYNEFVATSRPFLRQVCPTRGEWVEPLLPKLQDVDVKRLSGGRLAAEAAAAAAQGDAAAGGSGAEGAAGQQGQGGGSKAAAAAKRNDDDAVNAARQRFLQRKQAAAGSKRK